MQLTGPYPHEGSRDYALRMITQNIVSLALAPGSRMSEAELAEQMGLSRTPVREALHELDKSGIVKVSPQRGTEVSYIDYAMLDEIMFLRSSLECAVLRVLCALPAPLPLEELEDNLLLEQRAAARDDREALMQLDNEFHRLLFCLAGKRRVYELMAGSMALLDRERTLALSLMQQYDFVDDHAALLKALRAQNADEALEVMQFHLSRYQADKPMLLGACPQYFAPGDAAR